MNHDSSAITPPDAERVRAGAYGKVLILAQDTHRGALVPDQGPVQRLASGEDRIVSPYDTGARYGGRRGEGWLGGKALVYTRAEIAAFLPGAKAVEFDDLA